MGYMGIQFAGESDMAADLFGSVGQAIAKVMKQEYKSNGKSNGHNTSAAVNCGFLFRDVLVPAMKHINKSGGYVDTLFFEDDLVKMAEKTKKKLKIEVNVASKKNADNWNDEGNRLEHSKAYKSMLKAVEYYLDQISKD